MLSLTSKFDATSVPRILFVSARLPTVIQNGVDLRVRNQVLSLAESFPTGLSLLSLVTKKLYLLRFKCGEVQLILTQR